MTIIDEKIAEIRAGLDGVTPSPWLAIEEIGFEQGLFSVVSAEDRSIALASFMRDADAKHIARLDPQTVAALLDRLDAAEAENARLRGALEPFATDWRAFEGFDPDGPLKSAETSDFRAARAALGDA